MKFNVFYRVVSDVRKLRDPVKHYTSEQQHGKTTSYK